MDDLEMYEETEFDSETQQRLDVEVDKLLKGYDWTLSPLANKYVDRLKRFEKQQKCQSVHFLCLRLGQGTRLDKLLKYQ